MDSMDKQIVRTRFAPSPTGFMHVGGVRTALFAWLVAKQAKGKFILRLEDTDQAREVSGADKHIMKTLRALGLNYDEGPDIGGDFDPYRQSKRLDSYKKWAQKLIENGRAYADPYSKQELETFRSQARDDKKPFLFRNHRPEDPPKWDHSQPLRFKSEPKAYQWHDEVMGDLSTGAEVIDDFILIKPDGYPTYNFAHIIDDYEMQISHVIRGQEFLASMPNYLNLYEALEFERPMLATMPHILGPDGNKKLSKRDGAKDVLDYIDEGYLPEALINFIASMGWNDGTEQEIFSREELIGKFSLDHVQKSGARFDERRLLWMNGQYIANLSDDKLLDMVLWGSEASSASKDYKLRIINLIKLRLRTLADGPRLSIMFFEEPSDEAVRTLIESADLDKSLGEQLLKNTIKELGLSDFSEQDLKARLNALLVGLDTKPSVLFSLIRISVSGQPYSPELFGSLSVLGKEKTMNRLHRAASILDS